MYLSADCDANATTARGVFKKDLPNGITSQDSFSNRYFADGTFHRQYLTLLADDVCTGRTETTLGGHPFAGGDGTRDNPYIICSVPQFHAINSNPAYMTASFKLSADLDFNPYSVGLTANTLPAEFVCLEPGSNFMPIGYVAATCNAATKVMTWNAYTAFSGTFDGGNFTIKNLRLREDSVDHIGIFAKLYSTLKDYGNFHVEKAELEGSQFVGLLAGEVASSVAGSNQMEIWSISAKNVDIQARGNAAQSNVGGLVGYMENGNLFRVNFLKSKVRGDGSRVGGIIGSTINVLLKEVGAEVDIDNKSQVAGKLDIGGVVGLANNTDFYYVKHEGGIYTDAHQVGGIAGSTIFNSTIQHFYTNSHIVTNSSAVNPKLGGVIGSWGSISSSPVGPGYSLSKVKSDCPTACQQGGIVGEIITSPSVTNSMYRLSTAEAGDGDAPTNFAANEVTLASIAQIRDVTFVTDLVTDTSGAYNWSILDGEYPRFDFENHPCVNGFSGAGLTTLTSPKLICNEAQYLAMSSASATSFYKLIANIRFPENSPDNDIVTFNGHLNGNGQALIAGGITANVNSGLGHIGTLNGSIRNLKVLGMSREGNVSTPSTPHGTVVAVNNGTLENILVHTYSNYYDMGAGVVGRNTLTGQMKRIKFEGVVKGHHLLTTLAYQNEGLIEDSKASGEIKCIGSTSCNYIAGLAIVNQGRIKRTEMSVRVSEASTGMINYSSMLVDTNEYLSVLKPGILQDILVPDYAEFKVSGTNASYFHRQNLSGASLERIAHFGKLLFDDPSYSTFTSVLANFPSATDAINADGGSHTDVRRSGGRSGKYLLSDAPFICFNSLTVRIPTWNTTPDFGSWDSNLGSGAYNGLTSANKHLVIELSYPGGPTFTQKVIGYANGGGNYDFSIPVAQCGGSGKATIYYTNDLAVDDAGNGVSGTMLPQSASQGGNYGGPWQALMYDTSIAADNAALFAYYGFLLGVTTTPMTPRIWELSEDYPRLFNND